jgi:hypothetical protein
LAHSLLGFFRERLPDTLLLPAIAITSENLGFWGFLRGWEYWWFAGECVYIFFQKWFPDFSRQPEFFPDFL